MIQHRGNVCTSHPAAPDSNPGSPPFLIIASSLWTVLRSNPPSTKQQGTSQMQLAETSQAKYYKNRLNKTVFNHEPFFTGLMGCMASMGCSSHVGKANSSVCLEFRERKPCTDFFRKIKNCWEGFVQKKSFSRVLPRFFFISFHFISVKTRQCRWPVICFQFYCSGWLICEPTHWLGHEWHWYVRQTGV